MVVVDAVAATQARPAISEHVVSKTEARPDIHPGRFISSIRKSLVTRIEHAARRLEINARLLARTKTREMPIHVRIRKVRVPAHSDVEREFSIDPQIVLDEETQIMKTSVLVLADALRE